MRKLKKIIAFCLLFSIAFSVPILAEEPSLEELNDRFLSDLVDIERVYQYDMIEKQEQGEESLAEVLRYPQDVQMVTALGIMDYLPDGNFGEDKNVPFNEFAGMLLKLRVGKSEEMEKQYAQYGDTRPTKMGEAVHYLVEVLGYHLYEPKYKIEQPRNQIAKEIGLLKGVSYLSDKLITRGELACLFANALEIDIAEQTVFGSSQKYEAVKGKTILQEYFSVIKIEGLVTAIPGAHLLGGMNLESETIEIDRVPYRITDIDPTPYLGHRVLALLKTDENRENIISLGILQNDKMARISLSDVVTLNTSEVIYRIGETEEKISLRGVTTVTRNGESVGISFLNTSLLGQCGELMLCASQKDGGFDIAAIRLYDDFVVQSVSGISERISLAYGQSFRGNTYINMDIPSNHMLTIVKNGEQISYTQINAGDVLTVTANQNGSIINIVVSDKKAVGEIKQTENNNKVVIGKSEYIVSNAYQGAMQTEPSLPALQVRTMGTFYLSFDGRIVGYKNSTSNLRYGYMTKMKKGKGLDDSVEIRIFDDEGEWANYPLAKSLTLDGENKVSRADAYAILLAAQSQVFENLIRFDVNGKGEVIFLDTARIKALAPGEADPEANDGGRIRFVEHFNETFNWKQEGVLNRSKYLVSKNAVLFRVPTDKEAEELYTVTKSPKFGQGARAELDLYSPNEFNMIPLIKQESTGGQISNDTLKYFVVTDIGEAVNAKGDLVNTITCFCHETNKWEQRKFYTTSIQYQQGHGLQRGDLVAYSAVGDELQDYVVKVAADARDTDITYGLLYYPAYALGTVTDIDAEEKLIKIISGTEECVFVPNAIGIYSTSTNKGYSATVGDLQVNDRIYVFGAHKNFTVIALR